MKKSTQVLPHVRLQFHIQHPSLEECWEEGRVAEFSGYDESDNPYPENSSKAQHWQDGWWAACYGEVDKAQSLSTEADHDTSAVAKSCQPAANEPQWNEVKPKKRWTQALKVAGAIASLVAAELAVDAAT